MIAKLAPNQKRQLRKIVQLSTSLQDIRYAINTRWREANERLANAKRQLEKAGKDLAAAESWASGTFYRTPKDREDSCADLRKRKQDLLEEVRHLTESAETLAQELETMRPEVDAASSLTERLLQHVSVDAENFEPTYSRGLSHKPIGLRS